MRTCLVGRSKLFRAGLRLILSDTAFAVSREVESVEVAHQELRENELIIVQKPDDIGEIVDRIRALKSDAHEPRIVLLADSVEPDQLVAGFAMGIDGYLLEEISPEALLDSLHLVALGEKVFPSKLAVLLCGVGWGLGGPKAAPLKDMKFSSREMEIMHWLTDGLPNKTIANKLAITEATVKVHVKTILKKLGAHNRTQAAIWAVQAGIASSPALVVSADRAGSHVAPMAG